MVSYLQRQSGAVTVSDNQQSKKYGPKRIASFYGLEPRLRIKLV